jgi:hypothetical protein
MERPEAVFRKWLDDITHLPFSQLLELYPATAENNMDCDSVGVDNDNSGDCEEDDTNVNDPKAVDTLIIRDPDFSTDRSTDDRDHKEINLSGIYLPLLSSSLKCRKIYVFNIFVQQIKSC